MALASSPGGRLDRPRTAGSDRIRLKNPYVVRFGVPVEQILYNGELPRQLIDLLVYIARDGVTTTDLFRRHGNANDVRQIIFEMTQGRIISFSKYTFYTLATVVKIFLLKIPEGLFGRNVEEELLQVVDLTSRMQQYTAIRSAISRLSLCRQRLLTMLLGIWFRIASHSEYNAMSSEAVANSVAMCLFRNVPLTADVIQRPGSAGYTGRNISSTAIQMLQILIDDFCVIEMLGRSNVRYFADVTVRRASEQRVTVSETGDSGMTRRTVATCNGGAGSEDLMSTSIEIRLTDSSPTGQAPDSQLDSQDPDSQTWEVERLCSTASAPEVNHIGRSPCHLPQPSSVQPTSLYSVRQRQLIRMHKRSSWFLEPTTTHNTGEDIMSRSFEIRRANLGVDSPARTSSNRSSFSSAMAAVYTDQLNQISSCGLNYAQDIKSYN